MENFNDDEKKIPDFFETRAQVRSDVDEESDEVEKKEEGIVSSDLSVGDDDLSLDEVPYDFRAEYKERIGKALDEENEEMEKKFFSVRMHAIGIGILIGVLVALLISVFLFGNSDSEEGSDEPVVITESQRPVKVRPTNPGGMEIPDQEKTIYKRMRTDEVDSKVERFVVAEEEPVRPQVPTREGTLLGKPRSMPESADEMELEVLSVQEMAVQAPVAKPQLSEKPVVTAEPKEEKVVQKPVSVQKQEQKTQPKVEANTWHVQLISLPSKAGAEKTWPKILKAHSALLSGLPHDVVEVQIKGKGTFYRLRTGSFKDRKDAQNLCDKLKARKQDCTITK